MSSAFKPCRACGKPVYAGAKRCPHCRAPTSWYTHLRSNVFPLLILALFILVIVGAALHGWLGETGSDTSTGSGAKNQSQASGPPATAAGDRPRPPLSETAHTATGAANTAAAQTVAALRQRNTERADAVTVRGERIEPGMSADRLFELVSKHDLLGQTMEPDSFNPPNLQFVKYYRIDNQEFAIELRKAGSNAPYRVTSVRVARLGERAGAKR